MAQDQGILKPATEHPLPAPYARQQASCCTSLAIVGRIAALPATTSQAEKREIMGQTPPGLGS